MEIVFKEVCKIERDFFNSLKLALELIVTDSQTISYKAINLYLVGTD